MPSTTKSHHKTATPLAGVDDMKRHRHGTPVPWKGSPPVLPDSIAGLDVLLRAEPVNLSRVSNEIRANPDLEFMIMRLGESLALPLEMPPCTVEEATIGLGTDRLRVLVYTLTLVGESAEQVAESRQDSEELPGDEVSRNSSMRFAEAVNLETLYLAGFLHWLGMDSRGELTTDDPTSPGRSSIQTLRVCGLTDIFMRDFITLVPFLDPSLLTPVGKAVSESPDQTQRKME